jgi:shikimate dehydrogenase
VASKWACLIGQPVAQSLSPRLHNAAFGALGIDARYTLCETSRAELPGRVEALRDSAWLGANVTAPHKQAVVCLLDSLSSAAQALGAVNTIINRGGVLVGDNTDAAGLWHWMEAAAIGGSTAVVLGAGGAARAAVWALDHRGAASIRVLNRTPERAARLVEELRTHIGQASLSYGPLHEVATPTEVAAGVIIHATSLRDAAPNVHPSWYSPDSVAIELAYSPPLTGFMQSARAAGARAENGLGMLLHQAALAFECWTGQLPPLSIYEAALADQVHA